MKYNKRLNRILDRHPAWGRLKAVLHGSIVEQGVNAGRYMIVNLEGETYLISEGQFKMHHQLNITGAAA